jgi:hypothetical protein
MGWAVMSDKLTRITVNLVPRAVVALHEALRITEYNTTDTVNRSIQLYVYLEKLFDEGKLVFIEDPKTGDRQRLVLL